MPIFYNLEAHLWIAYALFINGGLLLIIAMSLSSVRRTIHSLEVVCLLAFFISLFVNALLFYVVQIIDPNLASISTVFGVFSAVLLISVTLCFKKELGELFSLCSLSDFSAFLAARFLFYSFIFAVLFFNGALIEQVSDAWWHLSMANALTWQPGIDDLSSHLTGQSERDYPRLWHINLAVLQKISSQDLAILFNALTPWMGVLKVMAFYLFAWVLTKDRLVALLGLVLFMCLPGMSSSYLRVSAWPSHVAYTAFYLSLYFIFRALDERPSGQVDTSNTVKHLLTRLWAVRVEAASFAALCATIYFTHKVELVWLAIGVLSYLVALAHVAKPQSVELGWDESLGRLTQVILVVLLGFAVFFAWNDDWLTMANVDKKIAYALPVATLAVISAVIVFKGFAQVGKNAWLLLSVVFGGSVLLSIDWQHFASAFNPEMAYQIRPQREWPLEAEGLLGGSLFVPGWHLQLRDGLVPLGILAIPIAWILLVLRPSRATLFLSITGGLALLVCVSGYWHTWLREAMDYHSVWRIALLIFHPLVYALLLTELITSLRASTRYRLAKALLLLGLIGTLVFESMFRFSPDVVQSKRQHLSPQRHWNVNYGQNFVYFDAGFGYVADFSNIAELVPMGSTIVSDLPTSYYAAARLPGHVVNVHRHHITLNDSDWKELINRRFLCDATDPNKVEEVITALHSRSDSGRIFYLLNRDNQNRNLRFGCEYNRRHIIQPILEEHATPVFKGKLLDLYEF